MINETFLDNEYLVLQNEYDVKYMFGSNPIFNILLEAIIEGQPADVLDSQYHEEQLALNQFLAKRNLLLNEALAIYAFTSDYSIFNVTAEDIPMELNLCKHDLFIELMKDVPNEAARDIVSKVMEIAQKDMPLYKKYETVNSELLEPFGMTKKRVHINTIIRKISLLVNAIKMNQDLKNALDKSCIGIDIKLFRAARFKKDFNFDEFVGKELTIDQVVSTSALKEKSFSKYRHYNTIVEFFVDKNTPGIYIANLSCYDTEEQEVMLRPHIIKIIDIVNIDNKKLIRCTVS